MTPTRVSSKRRRGRVERSQASTARRVALPSAASLVWQPSTTTALVREAAVAALGSIGDERGLAAILAGTQDKPAIRRRAVLALAPFEGHEVDEALARARNKIRDWQVRQAAEHLGSEGDDSFHS